MSIKEAYDEWSVTYDIDENATRDLDASVTREILAGWQVRHVLEIGCGTGKNSNFLAQIARMVCALDFSPEMLRKAKTRLETNHVGFCLANLNETWPCADRTFDLVACNLVLEHIQNLRFIFSEAARTIEKQGRFFISELHPYHQYQGQKATFTTSAGRREIEAYTHHISDYLEAAQANGLQLVQLNEWWHEKDQGSPPRLVSFVFVKGS